MCRTFHLKRDVGQCDMSTRHKDGSETYTVTWFVYVFLLISRKESRPGPLALSFVVWSARRMSVSLLVNVMPFFSAVAWLT